MTKPGGALVSETVCLRPAAPADASAITDCVRSAYQHFVARIGRPPAPMLEDYASIVDERMVVLATIDDLIAGVLVLAETSEGFLLENVAVEPRWQGRGIGRTLLEHAEQRARSCGYECLHLYTNELMVENRYLYSHLGYREYDHRIEQGLSRVYMRKVLTSQT